MVRNQRDESIELLPGYVRIVQNNVLAPNGTANVSISNVAPAGVTTATISQWLIVNIGGTDYYIPMWT